MKKRLFALALVLTMLLATMTAIGSAASGPEEYSLPLAETETVISFATEDNPQGTVSYTEYLPAWHEFTKRTGIKIEFQVIPSASYNENIQTRLAAGMNLPDLLKLPPDPMQYADSGMIVPMDELINQYAPNIVRLYEDRPEIKSGTTAPDGHIYYLAAVLNARAIVNYQAPVYRQDWLDKLGLQLDTIEDWYAYLTAVRDNDMNDNGDPDDEIPLSASSFSHLAIFAWSYGLMLDYSDTGAEYEYWQADEDGKVFCMWTDPRLKDWLTEMNKWYAEGLIDKDVIGNQPSDAYQAKVTNNMVGAASHFSMMTPQWTTNMSETFPDAYWEVAYPPKGPRGDRALLRERAVSSEIYAISKDCKDPALVMKMLDYIYANPEGQLLMGNFGIEGVTFEYVDGMPKFTELISGDPRGDGAAQWEFGINGTWPRILMPEIIQNRFFKFPQSANANDAAMNYQVASFPNIIPTKDENQALKNMLADITTYRQEMITKFVIGTEPLDNFDKYVSTINAMGIEELLQIKQTQYNRVTAQ